MAKKIYKNKKVLAILIIVALAVVGGAVYIKASERTAANIDTTTQKNSTATKQYAATAPTGSVASSTANGKSGTTPSSGTSAGESGSATLPAPSGQLLNKQTISLSSTTPQTDPNLESICQTIAQASCDIDLTGPNGQVKDVGAQNTGSSGTVVFNWNAKTVGLTTGKWTVQAVVVQGNHSGTSHNEYLQVQP